MAVAILHAKIIVKNIHIFESIFFYKSYNHIHNIEWQDHIRNHFLPQIFIQNKRWYADFTKFMNFTNTKNSALAIILFLCLTSLMKADIITPLKFVHDKEYENTIWGTRKNRFSYAPVVSVQDDFSFGKKNPHRTWHIDTGSTSGWPSNPCSMYLVASSGRLTWCGRDLTGQVRDGNPHNSYFYFSGQLTAHCN